MAHIMDCHPQPRGRFRSVGHESSTMFEPHRLGDLDDGRLGHNTPLLNTRNYMFDFIEHVLLPLQQECIRIPKLTVFLEFRRVWCRPFTWATKSFFAVATALLQPLKLLKLGQDGVSPYFEVWSVRGHWDYPERWDFDDDEDVDALLAGYTDIPGGVDIEPGDREIMPAYEAWVRWHWRYCSTQDIEGNEMVDWRCVDPESEEVQDSWDVVVGHDQDGWEVMAYSDAQGVANRVHDDIASTISPITQQRTSMCISASGFSPKLCCSVSQMM